MNGSASVRVGLHDVGHGPSAPAGPRQCARRTPILACYSYDGRTYSGKVLGGSPARVTVTGTIGADREVRLVLSTGAETIRVASISLTRLGRMRPMLTLPHVGGPNDGAMFTLRHAEGP